MRAFADAPPLDGARNHARQQVTGDRDHHRSDQERLPVNPEPRHQDGRHQSHREPRYELRA
jgi:hypothetical protein